MIASPLLFHCNPLSREDVCCWFRCVWKLLSPCEIMDTSGGCEICWECIRNKYWLTFNGSINVLALKRKIGTARLLLSKHDVKPTLTIELCCVMFILKSICFLSLFAAIFALVSEEQTYLFFYMWLNCWKQSSLNVRSCRDETCIVLRSFTGSCLPVSGILHYSDQS